MSASYFDGCYFDSTYFDASLCGPPQGGHPGRTLPKPVRTQRLPTEDIALVLIMLDEGEP